MIRIAKIVQHPANLLLLVMFLSNACGFSGIFPLTINDVDTLTVFRHWQDSLAGIPKSLTILDSISVIPIDTSTIVKRTSLPSEQKTSWHVTVGAFKIRENAIRKYKSFNTRDIPSYITFKNNLYYVLVGNFYSEDSVQTFRKRNLKVLSTDNYISTLTTNDSILLINNN